MFEGFEIDPRLAGTSFPVADWPLCALRLKDDVRFPWLLLIPKRPDIVELTDLDADAYQALCGEILRATRLLQAAARPDKVNVATLGNVVPQMHVHVIARFANDPAWPDPVWCHPAGAAYSEEERDALLARLREAAAEP
jgi:diadenosine tetraphosphate (Ap4A) HIT family hydrolase